MALYIPPGQRSAGVLGKNSEGRPKWREVRERSDFQIMIDNIKDTPMYQVIKDDILNYDNPRYIPERTRERDKRILLNINGVQLFLFNDPDPIYREDFNKLIQTYKSFYQTERLQINLTRQNLHKIDYLIKKKINYGNESSMDTSILKRLDSVEGMSNVLNERINGLEKCYQESLKGNRYFELVNLSRLPRIQEFFKTQKIKEMGIRDRFNMMIEYINGLELPIEEKIEIIRQLKKDKNIFISESILFNNRNIPYNKDMCRLNTLLPTDTQLMIDKYVIPQGRKVFILGRFEQLLKFNQCSGLFHILGGVNTLTELKPNEPICSKYVLYTLFLNRLYIAFSLAKRMDIPLIYALHNNPPDKVFKYTPATRNFTSKRFIGILKIPFLKENESPYYSNKYIFIFESKKTNLYPHYGVITHYQLFDIQKNIIIYGTISKRKTIVFDELDLLNWLSRNFTHDNKVYFYRDPGILSYFYISTKHNLHDKSLYPQYDLIPLSINKWKSKIGKQIIIFNEGILSDERISTISSIDELSNSNYILSTF
jgi:hypothetical protein